MACKDLSHIFPNYCSAFLGKASDVIELWEKRAVRIADLPFTVLLTRIGLPVSRKKKVLSSAIKRENKTFSS